MNKPVFVELLTPDGDVINRTKCVDLPIRIGRAYDNDIILNDPHTAAYHAQVELNQLGELVITDLGSKNGIALDNQRGDFFVASGDAVYRLGHTRLRIRTADYVVAPELDDSINHRWEGWPPAVLGAMLLVAVGLLSTWLGDLQQGTLSRYGLELVGTLGFALAWAGVWALFSKLFSGAARFGRHLFIVCSGLAFIEVWEFLSGALAYAFSWEWLARFTSPPIYALIAVVLYFHLRAAGNKRPARLQAYLAGLAVIAIGITMAKGYQASNHLSDELYLSKLYPPALRLSNDISVDKFTANIESLKAKVDSERKENPTQEKGLIEQMIGNDPEASDDSSSSTDSEAPSN